MRGLEVTAGQGLLEEEARLVREHVWLAHDLAVELSWLGPMTVERETLGYAYQGLIAAARRCDPLRRPLFAAFAHKHIVGAILDAVEREHPDFARSCRMALDVYDDDEPAGEPGDGPDSLHEAASAMWVGSASFRAARREQGRSELEEERDRAVREEFGRLDRGDQAFFWSYADGLTWKALAEETGCSVSTAQRRAKSLRRLLIARLQARDAIEPLDAPRAEGLARGQEQLPP